MQEINPKRIQNKQNQSVSKTKGKKLKIKKDADLSEIQNEMDSLEEDLNEAFS